MAWLAVAVLLYAARPALAFDVPSGQPIDLQEVLVEELGTETWLRFRFVAPQIDRDSGDIGFDQAATDMAHLCDAIALPYAADYALESDVIVVSLSDRPTEFGQADADATQFFEAFRVEDGRCIWEGL